MNPLKAITVREMEYLHSHTPEAVAHGKARCAALWNGYQAGDLAGADLAQALCVAWYEAFYPNSFLRSSQWREMFHVADYARVGRPAARPSAPLTLYRAVGTTRNARRLARSRTRGDLDGPEYGWSWTASPQDLTHILAAIVRKHGRGQIYTAIVPPAALLAEILPHEHVIDTDHPDVTIGPYNP